MGWSALRQARNFDSQAIIRLLVGQAACQGAARPPSPPSCPYWATPGRARFAMPGKMSDNILYDNF